MSSLLSESFGFKKANRSTGFFYVLERTLLKGNAHAHEHRSVVSQIFLVTGGNSSNMLKQTLNILESSP